MGLSVLLRYGGQKRKPATTIKGGSSSSRKLFYLPDLSKAITSSHYVGRASRRKMTGKFRRTHVPGLAACYGVERPFPEDMPITRRKTDGGVIAVGRGHRLGSEGRGAIKVLVSPYISPSFHAIVRDFK